MVKYKTPTYSQRDTLFWKYLRSVGPYGYVHHTIESKKQSVGGVSPPTSNILRNTPKTFYIQRLHIRVDYHGIIHYTVEEILSGSKFIIFPG